MPSAAFGTYAEHETPAAGVSRVVRAVRLSDTSPPLYYVLLNGWTRWFGTGDVALRTFSLLCAVACFPLLWWLAIQIGGATAAVPALMLFGFAPAAVWYSIEGRMYSLVWLLVIATACLCVRLHATGFKVLHIRRIDRRIPGRSADTLFLPVRLGWHVGVAPLASWQARSPLVYCSCLARLRCWHFRGTRRRCPTRRTGG